MWNVLRKKYHSIYHPQPFLVEQHPVPNFEKGSEKMNDLGDLKSSTDICLGAYCVSCQKRP